MLVSQGETDLTLDNLIAEKRAKPMLVVMSEGNMGMSGFNENAFRAFENELKQAVIPVVEKITGLYRMLKIARWPAYHWVVCKPYMPACRIFNYSINSGYLVPVGLVIYRPYLIRSTNLLKQYGQY